MGHAHTAIEDSSSLMNDTLVLRCLAALLIVNSHLEGFYPIRQLAADGLLGDSLFFLLSGWGLVLSERRSRRDFPRWYARRSARLHPSIFLVVFLFDYLPHSGWSSWSLADYLLNFGWGRSYGFVGQILTFYVLFFGIMRCGSRTLFLAALSALFLPYAALPILGRSDALFHAFHWIFYFQMMLFGGWLALSPEPIAPGGVRELMALLGLMSLYVATRVASASGRLGDAIFPPYLLIFPITYALLRLARADWLEQGLRKTPGLSRAVGWIGGSTLEIYLIHYQVLGLRPVTSLAFPLNVVAILIVSVVLARLLALAAGWLRDASRWDGPWGGSPRPRGLANLDGARVAQ